MSMAEAGGIPKKSPKILCPPENVIRVPLCETMGGYHRGAWEADSIAICGASQALFRSQDCWKANLSELIHVDRIILWNSVNRRV